MKVQNTSQYSQGITGIGEFTGGEQRIVTQEEAMILLRNPNFIEVIEKKVAKE